eukprot:jgi/Mesen1/9304/ME000060S08743
MTYSSKFLSSVRSRQAMAFVLMKNVVLCAILLLGLQARGCLAWGSDGHRMICAIAQPLLSKEASEAVKELLPPSAHDLLPRVCAWADEIKRHQGYGWTAPLHFIDTPDFLCAYNYSRDCYYHRVPNNCAAAAINNYTQQLQAFSSQRDDKWLSLLRGRGGGSSASYNLTEALMFLSHFVGDIHQPLHVGFTGDLGGNTIHVKWFGRAHNLHEVWDDEFIRRAVAQKYARSTPRMVAALAARLASPEWLPLVRGWAACPADAVACPDVYARESISSACRWAYRNATPGSLLEEEYYSSRLPIVESALARAGVRLAAILNGIFAPPGASSAQLL